MNSKKIKPNEAKSGDKVYIVLKDGADRSGSVVGNDKEKRVLDVVGDNLVSMTIPYSRIERVEKVEPLAG